MTGTAALQDAVARLRAAGVDDPAGDARRLLLHAFGSDLQRHQLAERLSQPLPGSVAARFQAMVTARAARQPVSQITGRRAFWTHDFAVTRDTLDPRPETEVLVEAALGLSWHNVLDLGTGTGAILISLLAARPGSLGLGTDVSEAALRVARGNATRIGVSADFRLSDWFANVAGRFDLIVSNPPYIAISEMTGLSPEVREWEPAGALTDGGDGLSAYRAIAAGAGRHLNHGGHVLCEIGAAQGPAVSALFREAGAEVRVITDLDGRDRVVASRFRQESAG
ncbi:peptide chain release factor N(5)-glutamine methyltransferase [Paracoccus sp. TK19116]|uniref:Release factor glutamine methyltransferase n=1 Tax=Paracoccus albicereus TaxID=2922394 RepID=A0ABT1MUJ2_9RHOB|nr:peptide chain release factor N(5)-glutamine methyltransferase [Paracoccus albicereus]MCQ0970531.1 peptide chain release factor N(5)-glutamine methyltransferase [Paracoccus albicereus]